jgi:L-malate glycosyltransferase
MNASSAIISPMPKGSGAFVLHKMIESHLTGYRVVGYSPWLTLFPVLLPRVLTGIRGRVVHTCLDYGLFFRRTRTPLVLTIHNYVCDASMRPYSSFLQQLHYATDLKWFICRSIEAATVLTSVSDYSARLIGAGLNMNRNIRVIRNGVDEKRFIPGTRRIRSHPTKVLFSGNLTLRKGAQWLPTIAARLGRGILIQYTSGLGYSTLRPKMPNTIDLGHVAWEDMPGVYQASDILISPTVREGLSLAILEAMACGLPVVASDCSSLPELIDDGKGGFLCPVGDTGAFAERINLLASTPELRRQMGEYNRAKVEKMFTLERMVSEYQRLFESLL